LLRLLRLISDFRILEDRSNHRDVSDLKFSSSLSWMLQKDFLWSWR